MASSALSSSNVPRFCPFTYRFAAVCKTVAAPASAKPLVDVLDRKKKEREHRLVSVSINASPSPPSPAPVSAPTPTSSTRIPLLSQVYGVFAPSRLVCIIGSSGSGKSSLFDTLSDRNGLLDAASGAIRSGNITVNGEQLTDRHRCKIAYVYATPTFFELFTVEEYLRSQYHLTHPLLPLSDHSAADARIASLLSTLYLSFSLHMPLYLLTPAQRRSVSIASALLSEVSLLFIDDVTNGLDSTSALTLVHMLKHLCVTTGLAVVVTVQQPSYKVFYACDDCYIMAGGRMVYAGCTVDAVPYFSSLGYYCPYASNPPEYFIDCMVYDARDRDFLIAKFDELILPHYVKAIEDGNNKPPTQLEEDVERQLLEAAVHRVSFSARWRSFRLLFLRHYRISVLRTFTYSSMFQCILLSLIIGMSWYNLGTGEKDVNDRSGLVFIVTGYWLFQYVFSATATYAVDYLLVHRDRSMELYTVTEYFFGKMLAETLTGLPIPALFTIIYYWMANVNPSFSSFVLYFCVQMLIVVASESMGLLIGAMTLNATWANSIMTVILYGLMTVGGFFVKRLSSWFSWIKWLSVFTYAYHASLESEFETDRIFTCDGSYLFTQCLTYWPVGPTSTLTFTGADVLNYLDVPLSRGTNVGILCLFIIGFRVAAYIALLRMHRMHPLLAAEHARVHHHQQQKDEWKKNSKNEL